MKPRPPKCTLARVIPVRPDPEEIKRRGWVEQKILVVRLDDPRLDFVGRQMVKTLGEALYGAS